MPTELGNQPTTKATAAYPKYRKPEFLSWVRATVRPPEGLSLGGTAEGHSNVTLILLLEAKPQRKGPPGPHSSLLGVSRGLGAKPILGTAIRGGTAPPPLLDGKLAAGSEGLLLLTLHVG